MTRSPRCARRRARKSKSRPLRVRPWTQSTTWEASFGPQSAYATRVNPCGPSAATSSRRGVRLVPVIARRSCVAFQPAVDVLAKDTLRLAAHEYSDVAAGQRQLGIVLRADMALQRLRAFRRDDVVLFGENVQQRHVDLRQVDLLSAEP